MNVYKLGVIVEIGMTETVRSKYKTKNGLENRALKEIKHFLRSLSNLGEYEVGYTEAMEERVVLINDFCNSSHYQPTKSEKHDVYRYFGADIFVKSPYKLDSKVFFFKRYWFEFEELPIMVSVSSFGDRKTQKLNKEIKFIGETDYIPTNVPV